MTLTDSSPAPGPGAPGPRPSQVTAVARLTWLLVGLGAVLSAVCLWRPDDLVSVGIVGGYAPGYRYQPPTFAPVVVVLYVVLAALVLVLLRLLLGGHGWARHSLAVTLGLLVVGTLATVVTSPSPAVLGYVALSVVLELLLLRLLYRPAVGRWMVA